MKHCLIRLDPATLCNLLGLPAGATVDGVTSTDVHGQLVLKVSGYGSEVRPGDRIPQHVVVVECKHDRDGLWSRHRAVPMG